MKHILNLTAGVLSALLLLTACGTSGQSRETESEMSSAEETSGMEETTAAVNETDTVTEASTEESTEELTENEPVTEEPTESELSETTGEEAVFMPQYVSLGDSIANGYGLGNEKSYTTLLAEALGYSDVLSECVDGQTSSDLLAAIGASTANYEGARLVTVSTGANNILGPAMPALLMLMVAPEIGVSTIQSPSFDAMLRDGITRLRTDLPKIVSALREKNGDMEIVLLSVYNPFRGVKVPLSAADGTVTEFDLGSMTDDYIRELNLQITETAEDMGCTLADVYTAFEESGEQNVNVTVDQNGHIAGSYDPHPNAAGHRLIAEVIEQVCGKGPNG